MSPGQLRVLAIRACRGETACGRRPRVVRVLESQERLVEVWSDEPVRSAVPRWSEELRTSLEVECGLPSQPHLQLQQVEARRPEAALPGVDLEDAMTRLEGADHAAPALGEMSSERLSQGFARASGHDPE